MQPWQPLLDFWFGPLIDGVAEADRRQQWFLAEPNFDAQCSAQFGPLLAPALAGELDDWLVKAHGRLAFIILTDQMPRNIYRGSAQAYAWDTKALQAAKDGVAAQADRELGWDERSFFYMPFEHAENLLDQHLAVGLFALMRDESPGELRNQTGNSLRFAQQHRDIILRFGRFPHRNAVLGRKSSAQEVDFVAGSDGFGQSV
jgi:uncharacterized protein (DUF924 family)